MILQISVWNSYFLLLIRRSSSFSFSSFRLLFSSLLISPHLSSSLLISPYLFSSLLISSITILTSTSYISSSHHPHTCTRIHIIHTYHHHIILTHVLTSTLFIHIIITSSSHVYSYPHHIYISSSHHPHTYTHIHIIHTYHHHIILTHILTSTSYIHIIIISSSHMYIITSPSSLYLLHRRDFYLCGRCSTLLRWCLADMWVWRLAECKLCSG